MNWQERISLSPDVRSGKPCIKGTRITVYDLLEYLAGGMSEDEILSDFPDLTREDIRAALAFAAAPGEFRRLKLLSEENVSANQGRDGCDRRRARCSLSFKSGGAGFASLYASSARSRTAMSSSTSSLWPR
jgi:uncharacterized protein (DUF433 family)